jgi:hypothetical protein
MIKGSRVNSEPLSETDGSRTVQWNSGIIVDYGARAHAIRARQDEFDQLIARNDSLLNGAAAS